MIFHILRQKFGTDNPYWQDFTYTAMSSADTVATALFSLPVVWENSCLQKKCGACAMVIDGKPALACDTFLRDFDKDVITIEPLKKFPVIEDLHVDRESVFERLRSMSAYLNSASNHADDETVYETSKCIHCGLCLEVCPNFCREGRFGGAQALTTMGRIISETDDTDRSSLIKTYRKYVFSGCGKSLACADICPAGIDTEHLMSKMNRL